MVQLVNNEGAKLQLRIKFRSDDLEGFVERYGSDVSPGGIFIRSRQPLEVGTRVVFSFALMSGVPVLTGEGTIVWVRQPEGEGGGNPGMGIRFDVLSDESRLKLGRILEAKTVREKSGKPPVRGPTPIPEQPFMASPRDATAKVRLTPDGRIVSDMPAPPAPVAKSSSLPGFTAPSPSAAGRAPSLPYASSHSNPQVSLPVAPPRPTGVVATEVLRRPTPALGTESGPQPFGPSKTLGSGPAPQLGPDTEVVRASQSVPNRAPTPAFGAEITKGAGGKAFSSTMAFGQEPTKQRRSEDGQIRADPTQGSAPAPDLLRRATPPPMPPTPPPSVFSRPTSAPGVPLSDLRPGNRSGPLVNRPSGTRPAVVEAPKPIVDPVAGGAWGNDKTEIVEDLPRFDEEERTTTVRGQTLSAAEGFGQMPLTRPDLPKHLTPTPPEPMDGSAPPKERATKSFPSLPALTDIFDGEGLPARGDSASLLPAVGLETSEFGRVESTGRGRRATPAPGASMVARKVETDEFRVEKRRPLLWIALAIVAVAGGVYAVVTYLDDKRPAVVASPAPTDTTPATAAPSQGAPAASRNAPEPAVVVPSGAESKPSAPAVEAAPVGAAEPPGRAAEALVAAETAEPPPAAAVKRPVFKVPPRPPVARPVRPAPAPVLRPKPAPAASPTVAATPAAAPAIEAEAVYWLRVRSTPSGADVFIDGEREGQTPFQRRIFDSTRPYAISVRKEGFEANERMISASDPWAKVRNEFLLTLTAKLRKLSGAAVEPAGAAEAAPTP